MTTRVLVPSGVLGLGFQAAALQRAVELAPEARPHIICIDGGSTDSGPYYLGAGVSKYSYASCKSEWRALMLARAELDVPLVITSCGTCGTDNMVDWMFDMTCELAEELGQQLDVALLYCNQSAEYLSGKLEAGKFVPLAPDIGISNEVLDAASHRVALAGAEQINQALESGADIVLAGRATDTASIAALPLARGESAGAAWHAAKIAECGALCTNNPISGVILIEVDKSGFTVAPMAEGAACSPHSVSAHMLYENADPFILYEPGGLLDVTRAEYAEATMKGVDTAAVNVTGSEWKVSADYTVKLEGAKHAGFQVTQLVILREENYVRNAREWVQKLEKFLHSEIADRMQLQQDHDYSMDFRLIGVDSVLGDLERRDVVPAEVGVLAIISAASEEQAAEIAKLANPFLLHYPLTENEELPTFAFPYSPAESQRGSLYEFCLNHVISLDDPMEAFRLVSKKAGRYEVT